MQIQSVAAPVAMKTEERPTHAIEPQRPVSPAAGKAEAYESVPSRKDLTDAVQKINESMLGAAQGLEFSIDEDTKDIVVKVIDQNTKEVVRQMPSEEALRMAKSIDESMKKLQGRLIDHTA